MNSAVAPPGLSRYEAQSESQAIISSKRPSSPSPPTIQLAFLTFTRRVCSLAPGTGSF
jgi:hypothetical protein